MNPDDFLKYAGEHYEGIKKKWSGRLKKEGLTFSEDIYNDSIIKVYEQLGKQDYTGNIEAYWYKAFLINTKRDTKYAYHRRDDEIDVLEYLKDFPVEDRGILLSDIEDSLKALNEKDKNLLLIYYLTDITITELEELTEIRDIKYRLKKIRGHIKEKGLH
jgi:DNA-directed RNA polymerase specialized sigma24 family protein